MNVSPLDLRQQRFRKAAPRLRHVEVTSFLAAVADDYEQALRETDRLRQDLMRMEAVLNRAPRAREEPAGHADDGAEALRRHQGERRGRGQTDRAAADAEAPRASTPRRQRCCATSDLLLEKTQARLEDIQREIDGLKLKRKDVEITIEATHPDAAQHARVRARAGNARARRPHPASPAAAGRLERESRGASDAAQNRRLITATGDGVAPHGSRHSTSKQNGNHRRARRRARGSRGCAARRGRGQRRARRLLREGAAAAARRDRNRGRRARPVEAPLDFRCDAGRDPRARPPRLT